MGIKTYILGLALAATLLGCGVKKQLPDEAVEIYVSNNDTLFIVPEYVPSPPESEIDLENKNKNYEYVTFGNLPDIYNFEKRLDLDSIILELKKESPVDAYNKLWGDHAKTKQFSRAQIQPQIKRYNFYGVPWGAYIILDFQKLTSDSTIEIDPLSAAIYTNAIFGGVDNSYIAIIPKGFANWINIVKETPDLKKYADKLDLKYFYYNNQNYLPLKPGSKNITDALLEGQKFSQPNIVYDFLDFDDELIIDTTKKIYLPCGMLIDTNHLEHIMFNKITKEFYTEPLEILNK